MPVVPMPGPGQAQPSPQRLPDPTFTLMAAAQMHSEGRLLAKDKTPADGRSNPPAQRR